MSGPIGRPRNQGDGPPQEHLHQRAVGLSAGAQLSAATAGPTMNDLEALVVSQGQLDAFLERMRVQVSPEDYRHIEGLCQLAITIKDNLSKVRHLLFGRKTETTDRVCPPVEPAPQAQPKPRKGHGR